MRVRISNPETGQVDLSVTGIPVAQLNSARAISNLVAELRHELKTHHHAEQREHG